MAAKKEVKVLRKSKKWDDLAPRIMAYAKLLEMLELKEDLA